MSSNETGLTVTQKNDIIQAYKQRQTQAEESKEEHTSQQKRPERITQDDIDTCWKELLNAIITTAESCIGKVKATPHSKCWWAVVPNIQAAHDKKKRRQRFGR